MCTEKCKKKKRKEYRNCVRAIVIIRLWMVYAFMRNFERVKIRTTSVTREICELFGT